MTERTTYTIACLSGHGIAPEVMAEASRALTRVSALHGFRSARRTRPSGARPARSRATRCPPPLGVPRSTLRRCSSRWLPIPHSPTSSPSSTSAPASIVSSPSASTAPSRCSARSRTPRSSGRSPVGSTSPGARAARASRRSAETCRGARRSLREAARHDGVEAEELTVKAAIHDLTFEPDRFDVVVTPSAYAEALLGFLAHGSAPRVAASSRLAGTGPSVFGPRPRGRRGHRRPGRREPGVDAARRRPHARRGARRAPGCGDAHERRARGERQRRPDAGLVRVGVGATTREFADVVISHLPHAMTTSEFYREAIA